MTGPEDVRLLYDRYLEEAERTEREQNPASGLWGFGAKAADAPCHSRFAEDLEALLNAMAAQGVSSAQAREALEYIYRFPGEHKTYLSVFWMVTAAEGLTLPLIPLLDQGDAQALFLLYREGRASRWNRLPAQEKVFQALKNRGQM